MSRLLVAVLISVAGLAPLHAKELSFGGIELGVTSCDDAEQILSGSDAIKSREQSGITLGTMLRLGPNAMDVAFVKSGTLICDPVFEDVVAIELIIDKGYAGTVADLLSQNYREQGRNLPRLGSGHAKYVSDSGKTSATISYLHVSFEAQIRMSTQDFDKLFDLATRQREEESRRKLEDAF